MKHFKLRVPVNAAGKSYVQRSMGLTEPIERRTLVEDISLRGARILVVDDVSAIRTILRRILEQAGAVVVEAQSGEEVLQITALQEFDLVLLDVGLPGMDGFSVCDALRASPRTAKLPVVVVTGMSDSRHHAEALRHGADDFVAKPLLSAVILARVGNLVRWHMDEIENRRLLRELGRYVSMPAAAQARKRSPTTSIRASILFSDLRDFTAAGIRESPEDLFHGVNVVMGHQAEIINAAGGYVDKFAGDGMLAVFSSDDENPTERAIEAGIGIIEWAKTFTDVRIWNPLPLAVGIATGDVMRGSLGSKDRQEYTVIGSTVNLACRICGIAGIHELVFCDETYKYYESQAVEKQVELKGMPGSQPVWVRQA
jgi:two-component system sensor histidine kinase ChiS